MFYLSYRCHSRYILAMYPQNPYIYDIVCRPACQAGRQEQYKVIMYIWVSFILHYLHACMVFQRCGVSATWVVCSEVVRCAVSVPPRCTEWAPCSGLSVSCSSLL